MFVMLNSNEHEISMAQKLKMCFLAFKLSDVVFILLINVKILTFMSMISFMLSC